MKSDSQVNVFAAGVTFAAIVSAVTIIVSGAANACADDNVARSMKMFEASGCIEFWMNRYQAAWSGLISAAVALWAAAIAWRSVQRQIGLQESDLLRQEIAGLKKDIGASEQRQALISTALDTVAAVEKAFNATLGRDERYIETMQLLDERSSPVHPFFLSDLLPALDRHIYRLSEVFAKTKKADYNVLDVEAELKDILDRILAARSRLEAEEARCQAEEAHLRARLAELCAKEDRTSKN